MKTISVIVLALIGLAYGASPSLHEQENILKAAGDALTGSHEKVETWPDAMIRRIASASKKPIGNPKKLEVASQLALFRESNKRGFIPSHLGMMRGLNGSFEGYVKRDFQDWASEVRVNALCSLLRPEFIPAAKDLRGQVFKDIPLRELPLNSQLGTSNEPVDLTQMGGRVGDVLIRAERIWTWSMITVCDTSAPVREKSPTSQDIVALLQRYFRYPLDSWGVAPYPKALPESPYLELLREDAGVVSGVLYRKGKPEDSHEKWPTYPYSNAHCFVVVSDGRFIHVAAQTSMSPRMERPNQW